MYRDESVNKVTQPRSTAMWHRHHEGDDVTSHSHIVNQSKFNHIDVGGIRARPCSGRAFAKSPPWRLRYRHTRPERAARIPQLPPHPRQDWRENRPQPRHHGERQVDAVGSTYSLQLAGPRLFREGNDGIGVLLPQHSVLGNVLNGQRITTPQLAMPAIMWQRHTRMLQFSRSPSAECSMNKAAIESCVWRL